MHLKWELLDLEQTLIAELENRRAGGWVEIGLNSYRNAELPLSVEDEVSLLAEPVKTVLRCTLLGPDDFERIIFQGRIAIPEESGDTNLGAGVKLSANDPLTECEDSLIRTDITYPNPSTDAWGITEVTNIEQSLIMWGLIAASDVDTIKLGDREGSVNRDRTYLPGKVLKDALVEMSEVENGPDFELNPIEDVTGKLVEFKTYYPSQGDDLSDEIRFVHGTDPDDDETPQETASAYTYTPGGRIYNRIVATGFAFAFYGNAIQPTYVAEHAASIGEYGVFEKVLDLPELTIDDNAALQAHAEAECAANAYPIPYFQFIPAMEQVGSETGVGVPWAFGRDYWIGDTIGLDVHRPDGSVLELAGRITDAKLIETDTGQLQVNLTCSTSVSFSGVDSEFLWIVQPEVEGEP